MQGSVFVFLLLTGCVQTASYVTRDDFFDLVRNHMPGLVADKMLMDRVFQLSDPVCAHPFMHNKCLGG